MTCKITEKKALAAKFIAFENVVKIKNLVNNAPFYASDVELSGGEINALQYYNFISPTGNVQTVFVPVNPCGTLYRKVEAKEWKINLIECLRFKAQMTLVISDALDTIKRF